MRKIKDQITSTIVIIEEITEEYRTKIGQTSSVWCTISSVPDTWRGIVRWESSSAPLRPDNCASLPERYFACYFFIISNFKFRECIIVFHTAAAEESARTDKDRHKKQMWSITKPQSETWDENAKKKLLGREMKNANHEGRSPHDGAQWCLDLQIVIEFNQFFWYYIIQILDIIYSPFSEQLQCIAQTTVSVGNNTPVLFSPPISSSDRTRQRCVAARWAHRPRLLARLNILLILNQLSCFCGKLITQFNTLLRLSLR